MDETPKDLPGLRRLNRRRMLVLTAGLASTSVASLLAACGGTSPPSATPTAPMPTTSAASSVPSQPTNSATSATTAKKGGMLHVVFAEEPVNLHPQIQSGTEGWYVEKQIYDSMVNIDGNGKIVPGLATDLPEQPDDRTYIFHLRQNVTFHNGKPFTADDVVWTFDRLVGKFSNLQSTQADRFKSHLAQVDKLDTYTVKITLSQPWTDFLSLMASDKYMSITQRDAEEANPKEYGQSVTVGTGPFMFKEWVKGDHLTLVRNDKYWGTPAYPDQIVYKAIPEDATRMSALGAGETDILFDPALKDVKQYGGNAKFRVQAVDGGNMKLLAFNTSRAPFTDRRVRQAILYALDRQEIVDSIYYSYAAVGQDLLPPWNPAHDPGKTYYPYDLEQAKKLLSDAGYGQSKPLEFEIVTTAVTEFTDLATLIQAQLQRVGVKVTVTALDKSAYYTKTFPQQGKANSNYQASIYRLKYGFVTEDYTYRTYHPSSTINIAGYNQPGGAQNPEVLTLLDHAGTITDSRQQKETYGKLSDLINEDAPMFCLAWQKTVSIIRAPVQNFTTLVLDVMPLKDVWLAQ